MFVLDKLYRGNISPIENYPKDNEAYVEAFQKLIDEQYELQKMLSSEAQMQFEKINELERIVDGIAEEECFVEGFRMGVQMMLDVLNCGGSGMEVRL